MKKVFSKVVSFVRKMGFFKRTILSLVAGFAATLLFAILYETAYFWMSEHTGIVIAAGLILSQLVLYMSDIKNLVSRAEKQAASESSKEEAERQPSSNGEETQEPRNLEKESETLGDDFAADDGKSDDSENPESFEDD